MQFKQTEREFRQFKAQFERGEIAERQLRAHLQELIVQDKEGKWWTVGYQSEQWYRYNGKTWERSELPSTYIQEASQGPNWRTVLWIALAWGISLAVGYALQSLFGQEISFTSLAIRGAVSGAIGGLATASILRLEDLRLNGSDLLWITLGGAVGLAVGWPTEVGIGGAIAGLVLALILKKNGMISDVNSLLLIVISWAIAAGISPIIDRAASSSLGEALGTVLGGVIAGAIGGFMTIWQIREAAKK